MKKYTRYNRRKYNSHYKKVFNLFEQSSDVSIKTENLSGVTVALALIPEAVAVALVAGLWPLVGLYAAIVVGFVTSVFGGRPGMIFGATGAIAIVIIALARSHGVEYVFATVILAGIIQMAAGLLKLGKFIRLVPHPVIFGFVNGWPLLFLCRNWISLKMPREAGLPAPI